MDAQERLEHCETELVPHEPWGLAQLSLCVHNQPGSGERNTAAWNMLWGHILGQKENWKWKNWNTDESKEHNGDKKKKTTDCKQANPYNKCRRHSRNESMGKVFCFSFTN